MKKNLSLIGFLCSLLVILIIANIVFGFVKINLQDFTEIYKGGGDLTKRTVIFEYRIPRAMISMVIGSALGIAGLLMQLLTRNDIASPSIFGINSGATLGVVLCITLIKGATMNLLMVGAFLGAVIAASCVYFLAKEGQGALSSMNLTLAGVAVSFLFSSFTNGFLAYNQKNIEEILIWMVGSVEGKSLERLFQVLPFIIIGFIVLIFLAKKLDILNLGDETAKSLGLNVKLVKLSTSFVVILLAAASVALTGPISLIGLIAPHVARTIKGVSYSYKIIYSGLIGANLLVLSDLLSRFIVYPQEAPVGVVTSLIGVPFFVYVIKNIERAR